MPPSTTIPPATLHLCQANQTRDGIPVDGITLLKSQDFGGDIDFAEPILKFS